MKNRKLLILSLVTIIVILAASITAKWHAPETTITKEILFPELESRINDIAAITIKGSKNTVDLKQQDELWVLASSDNYPALVNKVRATVINMAELKLLEEKTGNPDMYPRLGVEDPDSNDATSVLVTLKTGTGEKAASIIAGKPRQSAGSKPGLYVRLPDQTNALLVEGMLDVSANDADWFERNLFDIPSGFIKNVAIQYADGNNFEIYKEFKEQPDFQTRGIPIESSAVKIILTRIGRSMEEMRADGVKGLGSFSFPEETVTTTATTFDGLIITAKVTKVDNKAYAHFTFAVDPSAQNEENKTAEASEDTTDTLAGLTADFKPDPVQEAKYLTETLSPWVYQIPDFKYEALTSNPGNLKRTTIQEE
jgi:hypothetical protein